MGVGIMEKQREDGLPSAFLKKLKLSSMHFNCDKTPVPTRLNSSSIHQYLIVIVNIYWAFAVLILIQPCKIVINIISHSIDEARVTQRR